MYSAKKFHRPAVSSLVAVIMLAGCATTSSSLKFTQSELRVIPAETIPKILSSDPRHEAVKVQARGLQGPAMVLDCQDRDFILVRDKRGKESRLATGQITRIERIVLNLRPYKSPGKKAENVAGTVVETVIYASLIPVALALWSLVRVSGLDARENAEDNLKARLVYTGLTMGDLNTYVGEPRESYFCEPGHGSESYEVWIYAKDQVLRGSRTLFIELDRGVVEHNSYHRSFFKQGDNCTLIQR